MVSYFEPEDVESLAQAILDLSKNEIKGKAQAEKAKAFMDQYRWEKNKMDLINLYKEI
jgi:glycosyltransferase involved in cell wall biosynthesis